MSKLELGKPILIYFLGFPGSGKSYVSRSISNTLKIAHLNSDRIRSELFQNPRYDNQENAIVGHMMNYMTEEFLNAGVSVAYDVNANRLVQRRRLRELAKKSKAESLMVWLQIDPESAFYRTQNRDRRTSDDRYSRTHTQETFNQQLTSMQNPQAENYLVISGKHSFLTQKGAIINRLYQMGLINAENVQNNVTKPELVNLVPNLHHGRVDFSRRNITIR